jgi:hypothetical protein
MRGGGSNEGQDEKENEEQEGNEKLDKQNRRNVLFHAISESVLFRKKKLFY